MSLLSKIRIYNNIILLAVISLGNPNNLFKEETAGAYSFHAGDENCIQNFGWREKTIRKT
jgi:hypothetical protein